MAIRFAHMADIHLGAFRDERLRELNLRTFEEAIDICAGEELDFLIIAGDLFQTDLPDMSVVDSAVKKLGELKDRGMRIYMTYGSHDYKVSGSSLIDVLGSAALFKNVTCAYTVGEGDDEKVGLDFIEDPSGTLLCGLPGRKSALEEKYYRKLDVGSLEGKEGFKVFVFHSAITEMRPDYLPEPTDAIPLSLFPKGFDYYAGGHVHERYETQEKGYGQICFPGTLFGYNYSDLERGSKSPRGFYIVEHDLETGKTNVGFKEVRVAGIKVLDVDCDNMTPVDASAKLRKAAGALAVSDNVILVKAHGKIASGKKSDIPFNEIKDGFDQAGAKAVFINKDSLKAPSIEKVKVETGPRDEIEAKIFQEYLAAFGSKDPRFSGDGALKLCTKLLEVVSTDKPEGMTRGDHKKKIIKGAAPLLEIKHKEPVKEKKKEKKKKSSKGGGG